ncbi:MAG: CRISPR-associated helicase Cas3' [Desulfobacterium sp.]|nr:CRISPR-associated helicase Cas3' [Desulfobacterium sp.]MBU3946887.1 CRISPR-associated helicase Cas3' [Pseudomonadota bacterium]MBU4036847.1 CRISPR-associated helicase Cas3' [Pseudomonadota bacterium]
MKYYAHSENSLDEKHSLSKHLRQTAKLAESFACEEKYKLIFKIAGLLHDLGKYQPEFQSYLENGGRRGSVPHASWGAGYARILKILEASFAIDGHHKGLPDSAAWKSDTEPFCRGEVSGFEGIKETFIADAKINEADITIPDSLKFAEKSHREVFVRYLFSVLTDSDWLSTEEHFDKDTFEIRAGIVLPIDEMIRKIEKEFSEKPKDGEINRLRNNARDQVLRKANMPCGFYSLALPTGMGKTLTSMAWALQHAKKNDLKRIIIVLPYINIIDQTAQVLKTIFGEEWVLEHHSAYNEGEYEDKENCSPTQQRKKLACENWDYPIIVTTTVQFFESLFSNRPSQCRKIHSIAESVVIFDEVQTLPKEVILPTLRMLQDVQIIMKTSFLFCTATQPAFEKRQGFDGISTIYPLVDDPVEIYRKTKRVEYHLLNELNPLNYLELLEAVMRMGGASLVIFNTKKAALEFYNCARNEGNWEVKYHLSTAMCPAHRKDVIKKIRDDLGKKKNILVASTQLIEAGVDFDFPSVFRAIAPLEAVIQSAGRCNREDKLSGYGNVFLFKVQDGGMPDKTYSACAGFTEDLVKADINQLYTHDIFAQYYSKVINLFVEPDKYGINNARNEFKFKTVNDSYHIIQNVTEGLYIYNFSDESRQLLHSLEYKEFLSRDDYRKMQTYTVQVYKYFIFQNSAMCKLMPQGFMIWYGNYDPETGISVAPIEADKLIV